MLSSYKVIFKTRMEVDVMSNEVKEKNLIKSSVSITRFPLYVETRT